MAFFKGDEVEVCSKQDGFLGSYFAATVINNYGNHSYEVQYKRLLTDDESGPLIEVVDADEVRPKPPKILATGFASLDMVDAFDNDGWWVGKISGKQGSNYYVYFDTYRVEILYPSFRLRPHLDWGVGKWISSKKRV
jgi:hypothetical protein|uniref:Agenet domain-containing protein n=1 Tax=Fagus sylvatica TaxID=28930 RepID=A0A2N9IVU9_FAGSY